MFDAILELIIRIMAWQRVGKPLARITKAIIITVGTAITVSAIFSYLFEVAFGISLIIDYRNAWWNGNMTWIDNNTGIFVISAFLFLLFCFYGFVNFIIDAIKTRGKTIKGLSISDGEDIVKKVKKHETRLKAIEDLLENAKKNGKL